MTAPLLVKKNANEARATGAKILVKHGLVPGKNKAQVAGLFDISGSTEMSEYRRYFYSKGYMDGIVTTVLGLALNLDDNGTVPAYAFSNGGVALPEITKDNLDGYIRRTLPTSKIGGGTYLARGMKEVMKCFDRKSPDVGLVFVFTDGEASDADDVRRTLIDYSRYPVFWQFVGMHVPGDRPDFGLLEDLDNLRGRVIDNANFFEANVETIQPETILDLMLQEFKGYPALVAANSSRVRW